MEFSPPFERECQAVRKSIGLASTCARLRRIVIAAWCQKLLGVPIDNLGKGKVSQVQTVLAGCSVCCSGLRLLQRAMLCSWSASQYAGE